MLLATFCAISLCNPLWHRPKWFFEICTHGFLPEENNSCTVVKRTLLLFSHRWKIFTNTLRWGEKHELLSGPIHFFVMFQRAARLAVGISLHEVEMACPEFLAMRYMHSFLSSCMASYARDNHIWTWNITTSEQPWDSQSCRPWWYPSSCPKGDCFRNRTSPQILIPEVHGHRITTRRLAHNQRLPHIQERRQIRPY